MTFPMKPLQHRGSPRKPPEEMTFYICVGEPDVLAKDALKYNLHRGADGFMEKQLHQIIADPHGCTVALGFLDHLAVGAVAITADGCCMVFVKTPYRRGGRGSRLVQFAKVLAHAKKLDGLWAWHGDEIKVSEAFWKRNGIQVAELHLPPNNSDAIPSQE